MASLPVIVSKAATLIRPVEYGVKIGLANQVWMTLHAYVWVPGMFTESGAEQRCYCMLEKRSTHPEALQRRVWIRR